MHPFEPEQLPPADLDLVRLLPLIGRANRAIASFDGLLHGIPNPNILLSPLTTQEAVLSSRIEGTQADLEEVLKYEAGEVPAEPARREEIHEIINYRRALRLAKDLLQERPFCLNTLLKLHETLMDSVRGHHKGRGRFRTTQNWIGAPGTPIEQAAFVPPAPLGLQEHLNRWEAFWHAEPPLAPDPLVQLALLHAQFEILHPFLDGNGRVGRMLIPLFLCEKKSSAVLASTSQPGSRLAATTTSHGCASWARPAVGHAGVPFSSKASPSRPPPTLPKRALFKTSTNGSNGA